MKIIISPAKKMAEPSVSFFAPTTPQFAAQAEQLRSILETRTPQELMELYKCSEKTMQPVYDLLCQQKQGIRIGGPALLSYQGLAFQYMGADVFDDAQWDYVQDHLRILSGMYGVLRPKDEVLPYRLEMQNQPGFSLYDFWGRQLADALDDDVIINLASKEYSRIISKYKPVINIRFLDVDENGKKKEPGAYAKMARGTMVRWMAENNITTPEQLQAFDLLRYKYNASASTPDTLIFERPKL